MRKTVWPDYENSTANLPNSILKYFGAGQAGKTLALLDKHLDKEYKNVVVLLLDGMGKCIIDKILDKNGPFRSHLAGVYNSVFLSTTVASTTSILSGLQPCEHSWLGWDCYYPQIDKNVTVFTNTVQGTDEQAADYNVARTYTPYHTIAEKISGTGSRAYLIAPFLPQGPQSIEELCKAVAERCAEPERKYIYAYWNNPDGLLHRYGSESPEVMSGLKHIEDIVNQMADRLEDTLLIITADHGHIDNEQAVLQDYPGIMECLVRLPSLEPRVLNFFVKDGMEKTFEERFNREFGESFLLMPMEEVLEKKLFGTGKPHECFRGMLGNYLAVATDNVSIFFTEERWLSMHGSVTEEEMLVPLILFEK